LAHHDGGSCLELRLFHFLLLTILWLSFPVVSI
jgi:hypothetical protein